MTGNRELDAGLKAIAVDFHLPAGGRKKLSQLVAGHLWWFDAAEERGMSWRDMIRALTAAGVTGRGGQPISIGTLSSTVWRKRAEAEGDVDAPGPQRRPDPQPIRPPQKSPRHAKHISSGLRSRSKRAASRPGGDQAQAGGPASTPSKRATGEPRAEANKDVLAFMNRARAVRRRSEEN